jgi:hypothetical protein
MTAAKLRQMFHFDGFDALFSRYLPTFSVSLSVWDAAQTCGFVTPVRDR